MGNMWHAGYTEGLGGQMRNPVRGNQISLVRKKKPQHPPPLISVTKSSEARCVLAETWVGVLMNAKYYILQCLSKESRLYDSEPPFEKALKNKLPELF